MHFLKPFPLNMPDHEFERLTALLKLAWLKRNPGAFKPGEIEAIEAKYPPEPVPPYNPEKDKYRKS